MIKSWLFIRDVAIIIFVTAGFSFSASGIDDEKEQMTPPIFSDDFTQGSALDGNKWQIITGDGCPGLCGFGNNEKQTYTDKSQNLRIEDGILTIQAHAADKKGDKFTSAKIITRFKQYFLYGKISVKARLPKGVGTWPAIWMLPDENKYGGWPGSGEIDIMEHVGFDAGVIHGTIHTKSYNHKIGTHKGKQQQVADADRAFHIYSLNWTPDKLEWFIDDKLYYSIERQEKDTADEWPFDHPYHLILNLAVGGDWGGSKGIDVNAFPTQFEIDWVKVWQH